MAEAAARKGARPRASLLRRSLKILLWLLVFLVIFPALEVLAIRFWNPIYTPLMFIRSCQGRLHPGLDPTPAYRWVPLEKVSPHFLTMVWQTEDALFFRHKGFDWAAMDQAVRDAQETGKPARGASTITMQCARSLFLWQGRSWIRKSLEAYYTILLESMLTKRRIFELYVNVIETGDGIYGVEAASLYYWKTSALDLSQRQSAMLAAILPDPRRRNPQRPTPQSRRRESVILRKGSAVKWPDGNKKR